MEDDKDDRLRRSEYGNIKSSNFRKLILDALELLKTGQPQNAAFKIDDAMLSLPPDKRIGRGGIAEWAREWWQGHLAPIRANGGLVPGVVPDSFTRRNDGGSDIYLSMFGMEFNVPEVLMREILRGNVLYPHLPDHHNPAWVFRHPPGSHEPNSLLAAFITLAQVSEYLNVGSPNNPWLNAMLGLLHASMAHDQVAHKGIEALLDDYSDRHQKDTGASQADLTNYEEFFLHRAGVKGHRTEELCDLLTTPRVRSEWARINDELAVKHISKALRFLPWSHGFPLGLALGVCLARLGRYGEARRHMDILDLLTARPGEPVPLEYCYPRISVDDRTYHWFLGDQTPSTGLEVLKKRELTLGRSTSNDLVFPDGHTSREHAKVWMDEGVVWIQDLGSGNGTYLDGIRLGASPVAIPARKGIVGFDSSSTITLGRSELTLVWPMHFPWSEPTGASDRFDSQGFDSSCRYWEAEIGDSRTPDHFGNGLRMGIRAFASGNLPHAVELLDEAIASHIKDALPVPFELHHVRSECHEGQANKEQAEQDRRSAEESLAAEFSDVGP